MFPANFLEGLFEGLVTLMIFAAFGVLCGVGLIIWLVTHFVFGLW